MPPIHGGEQLGKDQVDGKYPIGLDRSGIMRMDGSFTQDWDGCMPRQIRMVEYGCGRKREDGGGQNLKFGPIYGQTGPRIGCTLLVGKIIRK